jgi:hypothetical protein
MEFLKKHWYLPVILALVLYIFTVPKKTYKVIPKDNLTKDSIIFNLQDSLNNLGELINQKNQLLLSEKENIKVETLEVKIPSKPKEIIIYKNEQVVKEVNCPTYYTDRERDSLWAKRITDSK